MVESRLIRAYLLTDGLNTCSVLPLICVSRSFFNVLGDQVMSDRGFVVAAAGVVLFALSAGSSRAASPQRLAPAADWRRVVRVADDLPQPSGEMQFTPSLIDSLPAIGVPAMRTSYPFITGRGQTVAVIDTGIDYTHSALSSRYVTGYDFANGDSDPMDHDGHGTHVSGVIASTDATYGGVAPRAGIISLKVFADAGGSASQANVTAALNWVAANAATYNITTVNMSMGDGGHWTNSDVASGPWESSFAALKNMGIFVSCGAGDNGWLDGVSYPAASPHTVSVGGTWASNNWSEYTYTWDDPYTYTGFELYDATMGDLGPFQDDIMVTCNRYTSETDGRLDVLAPAAIITSSYPVALDTTDGTADGWASMMGTSVASAHVAGAAVLVRQALELAGTLDPAPEDQVDQILGVLQNTGKSLFDDFWASTRGANNCNVVQFPGYSTDWYIRPSTDTSYSRIDLDAAIASIDPTSPHLVPGDATGDGRIDDEDAAILASNWGKKIAGGGWVGDFNGDGQVNAADAAILTANWGYVAEGGPIGVPEPGLLALLAGLLTAMLPRRRCTLPAQA